ncbi:MAG: sensor histidine kinase [Candidatus Omnitrophica bacterium]|nr:sensor histidine kinase [Candidatus Omnitrophota bacterium]MBU4478499.1 sensor histidine kinase [Candidatus Omnitrophota bacterium]
MRIVIFKCIAVALIQAFVVMDFAQAGFACNAFRQKEEICCLSPSLHISEKELALSIGAYYEKLFGNEAEASVGLKDPGLYIRFLYHDLNTLLSSLGAVFWQRKTDKLKDKIDQLYYKLVELRNLALKNNYSVQEILAGWDGLIKLSSEVKKSAEAGLDLGNNDREAAFKAKVETLNAKLRSYYALCKGESFEINGPFKKGKDIAKMCFPLFKQGLRVLEVGIELTEQEGSALFDLSRADEMQIRKALKTDPFMSRFIVNVAVEEDLSFEMYLNPCLFESVMRNLWKNALEHMGEPKSENELREIKIEFRQEGGNSIIVFSNTGQIEKGLLDVVDEKTGKQQIFLPGETTKRDKRGFYGLGLASVWDIVRAHGGTITAENKDGNAVFTIKFNRIELLLWKKVEYEEKCRILPSQEKMDQWIEHPPENFDAWIKWLADGQHGYILKEISKYGDAEIMEIKRVLNLGLPVYNMLYGLISEGEIEMEGKFTDIISYKLCFELNELKEFNVLMLSLMEPHIKKFKDISRGFYGQIGENLEEIGKSLEGMESLPDEEIIVKAELIGEHADSISKKINDLSKDKKIDVLFRLTMQHEVNNTLSGILSSAYLLKLSPERKEKYIPQIKQSLKRIHITLNRLDKMENFRIHPTGHHIEIYARQLNNFIMEGGALKESEEKVRLGVLPDGTDIVYVDEAGASIMVVEEGREVLFKIEKNSDSAIYTAKGMSKDGKTVLACANIPLKDEESYKTLMLDKLREMGVSDIVVPSALYKGLESRKSAVIYARKEDIVIYSETDTGIEELKIPWFDAGVIISYQDEIIRTLSKKLRLYEKDDNLVLLNKIKIDIEAYDGIRWAVSEGRLLLENKEGQKLLIYFVQGVQSITIGKKVYRVGENTLNDTDIAKVFRFKRTEDGLLIVRLAEITDNPCLKMFFEKEDSSLGIPTRDLSSETQNFIARAI